MNHKEKKKRKTKKTKNKTKQRSQSDPIRATCTWLWGRGRAALEQMRQLHTVNADLKFWGLVLDSSRGIDGYGW